MENTLERCYECLTKIDKDIRCDFGDPEVYLCERCFKGWIDGEDFEEIPEAFRLGIYEMTETEIINMEFGFAYEKDLKNLDKYLEEYSTLNFKELKRDNIPF